MENSTIPVRTPHYYEKAGPNLAVSIALPILAALVVSVRIHVRRRQKMPLDIDDWLTIPALILALGAGVTMIIGIAKHGLGYPTPRESTVPPRTDLSTINSAIITTTKAEYAMLVLSTPALGCIKMSVLFFYHRIFCPSRTGPARIVIIAMMILITLWTLGFGFTCIFPCKTDFSAWWGPTKDLIKKCISPFDLLFALTLSDFITDALVLIIPLPLLWKLKLSIAKKISVSAIFLLGMVALAASLTRLVFMSIARNVGFAPGADQDLTITGTLYWLMVEINLGLIAACLPTISILFKNLTAGSIATGIKSALSLAPSPRSTRSRVYSTSQGPQRNASTASHAELAGKHDEVEMGKSYELQGKRGREGEGV
ncbi:SNARE-binding exocyst subunit S6 [Clarireedia jacksonii]